VKSKVKIYRVKQCKQQIKVTAVISKIN